MSHQSELAAADVTFSTAQKPSEPTLASDTVTGEGLEEPGVGGKRREAKVRSNKRKAQ